MNPLSPGSSARADAASALLMLADVRSQSPTLRSMPFTATYEHPYVLSSDWQRLPPVSLFPVLSTVAAPPSDSQPVRRASSSALRPKAAASAKRRAVPERHRVYWNDEKKAGVNRKCFRDSILPELKKIKEEAEKEPKKETGDNALSRFSDRVLTIVDGRIAKAKELRETSFMNASQFVESAIIVYALALDIISDTWKRKKGIILSNLELLCTELDGKLKHTGRNEKSESTSPDAESEFMTSAESLTSFFHRKIPQ